MVFFFGLIMLSTGSIGDSNFKRVVVLLAVFITGLGIFSMYGGDMNIFVEHVMQNFSQIEGFEYRCPHNNKPPKTGYNCSEVACAKGYKKKECPLTCIKK
jgi:hypothetical protein